jgi:hypothetical protein
VGEFRWVKNKWNISCTLSLNVPSSVSETFISALQHSVVDRPGQVRLLWSAENLRQVHDPKVTEGRQGRNSRIQAARSLTKVRTPGDPKERFTLHKYDNKTKRCLFEKYRRKKVIKH